MDKLLKEERQQRILSVIEQQKRATVPELSQLFDISEVTIRRDLQELAATGKLQRAHRGAIQAVPAPPEPPVVQRMSGQREAKEQIAQAAAGLVAAGDSVFIGSGSTTTYLARALAEKATLRPDFHCTVVTNALNVAAELAAAAGQITVVVTGGLLRPEELSMLGHIAEQALQEVRLDRVLMGMQAVSLEGGLSNDNLIEVATTRHIIAMAAELVVLADHSKLGRTAAAYIVPLKRAGLLVTDAGAPPEFLDQVRAVGVKVLIAS